MTDSEPVRQNTYEPAPLPSGPGAAPGDEAFRCLADTLPHLVWTARPDGTVDYYNRQVEHYAGLRRRDDGTWEWRPVLHPDDAEQTVWAWRRAVKTEQPYEVEHRVRMAGGTYRWHVSRARPLRDAQGLIHRWCGTATDVHQIKEAEAAARRSEARFRALFEGSQDAILLANDAGVYTDANPAATSLLGYEFDELAGMTIADVSDVDDASFLVVWATFLQTGRMQGEYRLRMKGGDLVDVEFSAVANVLPGQHLSTLRNVTERKRAEAALRQSEEHVRELSRSLTLSEQRERQRIAHVLHDDLQQLLGGVRMLVPSQPHQGLSPARVEALQDMVTEAVTVTRTLSHELAPPLLKGDDLGDLLRWLAERKRQRHAIEVEVDVASGVSVPDEALRVLLYQLVRELLFNVVKHAGTHRARVVAEQIDSRVRVTVEDEGTGFDLATLEEDGTTGLGLPSVRERLELLGGTLEVESAPGEGTRVTITVSLG